MYGQLASVLTVNIFIPSFSFDMQQPSKFLCFPHRLQVILRGNSKTWKENVHRCALYLFSWNKSAYSSENVR